jgi:hypothetical protein
MIKKKNKFLTFVFSLLPGAGHMYLGFMKMGLSLMSAFFFIIFLSSWLNIGPLQFVLPILWFYSFFDCLNKTYSTEEEFLQFQDTYLFSLDKMVKTDNELFQKPRLLAGTLLLLLGIYLVWNNFLNLLSKYIPSEIYDTLSSLTRNSPQIIIGIAIIVVGAKLILGKKKESDLNA